MSFIGWRRLSLIHCRPAIHSILLGTAEGEDRVEGEAHSSVSTLSIGAFFLFRFRLKETCWSFWYFSISGCRFMDMKIAECNSIHLDLCSSLLICRGTKIHLQKFKWKWSKIGTASLHFNYTVLYIWIKFPFFSFYSFICYFSKEIHRLAKINTDNLIQWRKWNCNRIEIHK